MLKTVEETIEALATAKGLGLQEARRIASDQGSSDSL